jgi:hypothetical protein
MLHSNRVYGTLPSLNAESHYPSSGNFDDQIRMRAQRNFSRTWPNQQEVTVKGAHFLQEESPQQVADATASFVSKVQAGQIRSDPQAGAFAA